MAHLKSLQLKWVTNVQRTVHNPCTMHNFMKISANSIAKLLSYAKL